jgi:hypothetical protein
MKIQSLKEMNAKSAAAFTRLDLAIVIATLGILVVLLLYLLETSAIGHRPRRATRVTCTVNLRQVSLAFALWMDDHKLTNFPWEVSAPIGTAPDVRSSNVFRHFGAISNEFLNLRVLTCPADKARKPAASWGALRNENISYFINVTPPLDLQSVLAGDRHLTTNHHLLTGYNLISAPDRLRWTKLIHEDAGNVVLVDGSAHQTGTRQLQQYFTNTPPHLAFP